MQEEIELTEGILALEEFPQENRKLVDELWRRELSGQHQKILVLDDDPTGVQTVHDVSVYTDWSVESIRSGFLEKERLFFILTNSRSFTAEQTRQVHGEIAKRAAEVSRELGMDYLIISRSDSTLRGHYPLETQVLREITQKQLGVEIDGEILCPYFKEGGRFTIGDVHYVKIGNRLVPACETEFAGDRTFGYKAKNLREYIEEKTAGAFSSRDVVSISLEELRRLDFDGIENKLMKVRDFRKVVVNAVRDEDLKVFVIALYRVLKRGKRFILRTAASMVKIMGGVSDMPLLTKEQLSAKTGKNGGIIIIGSHTDKTTEQMNALRDIPEIRFVEINTDLVLRENALEEEIRQLVKQCDGWISEGRTVAAYTKRRLLEVDGDTKEAALVRSVRISEAVQSLVGNLHTKPSFVVAKGGITSSDVGTKALKVKRARVLGQICPGIPVWDTGEESRFPGILYVIFPGNVGEKDTLRQAAEKLL